MTDFIKNKEEDEKEEGENLYTRLIKAAANNSNLFKFANLFDKLNNDISNTSKAKLNQTLAGKAILKTGQVVEQAQRTAGGAAFDVAQESLQLANLIADKTNLIEFDEDLNRKQQASLQNIMTNLFGEETVETVTRGGREVVKVKEPEYFGGSFARDIGSIIGSVVVGTKGAGKIGQLSMKTKTGKEIADNIAKSKVKTALAKTGKVAVGASVGEQISINPYEERLANFLGEFVEDDEGAFNDIIEYLKADESKSEAEARLGLFFEGLAFTVGLPAAFFGGKLVKEAFKNKDAAMETLRSLRQKVQAGKLDVDSFKDVISSAKQKYKSLQEKGPEGKKLASFPYSAKPPKIEIETGRAPKFNKADEDIEKLWQFSPNKVKRAISKLGLKRIGVGAQEIFRSRGYMTPQMFAVFNKRQAAKTAWIDATENVANKLDFQIKNLSAKYDKYKDPTKIEEKINTLLQNPNLSAQYQLLRGITKEGAEGIPVSKRVKNSPLSNDVEQDIVKFFDGIPAEMIDDLGGIRLLLDDFSEMFLQLPNNQISKELKETISNNIGSWLHRSYEVFESPALAKRRAKQFEKYAENLTAGSKNYLSKIDYLKEFDAGVKYYSDVIRQQKKFANADEYVIMQEAVAQIQKTFDDILNPDGMSDYFGRMDSFFGANTNIFKRRGDIDEPLRDLLGEIKSPTVNILKSVSQVASYIEDTRFANEAYAMLKGRTALKNVDPKKGRRMAGHIFSRAFIDEKTGVKYTTQLKGKQFGALNGKYMTEEMAMMFGQRAGILGKIDSSQLYKNFLLFKGYAQASKTVFNHITHLRNTIGGAIFTLANGNNPFSKEGKKAIQAIHNRRFKNVGKEEALNYYNKLIALDVVNSGVKFGEVESLLKDAADSGVERFTANRIKDFSSLQWASKKAKKIGAKVQDAYIAEDDFFKIVSFEQELDNLMKAAKGSKFKVGQKSISFDEYIKTNPRYLEDLEREAARIVRDTIPTYSLVPTGIKQLRKLPIGNFFSFPAEMVRTSINIAKQGTKELFLSGNTTTRLRGARRLAGFGVVGGLGSEGLNRFTKMWHGVSDEEEQALRNLNPYDYSKNSKFIYYRDKEGNLYKNDFSFIDPYDVIKRPIQTAIYEIAHGKYTEEDMDKILLDASKEGITEFFRPFVSEALLTSSISNLFRGETIEGYPIDNWENVSPGQKASTAVYEIWKAFAPGALREIPKTAKAFMGDEYNEIWGGNFADILENITTGKTGEKEYTRVGQVIANTTGLRFEKIDIDLELERKAKQYLRDFDDSRQILGDQFAKRRDGNDVLEGMARANKQHYYAYKELKLAFDAAERLGMSKLKRNQILKDANVSEQTRFSLGLNRYVPIVPSEAQYERFEIENNKDAMGLHSLKYYVGQYNRTYQSLPMINITITGEEDTKDGPFEESIPRKALEFVREPEDVEKMKERVKNSKGGFIEGPDVVPFTKEDPAERINPFTGEPYKEEEREMFYSGGSVVIDEFDNPVNLTDEFLEKEQEIADEIGKALDE
jgi:hypothetical protein